MTGVDELNAQQKLDALLATCRATCFGLAALARDDDATEAAGFALLLRDALLTAVDSLETARAALDV